ncbi:MAG: rod shape-determining protein MreD [Gammaproteobacteria bacterium]|nr:rod shape-determining protein MreD [Gammaproteobacteria bacterium]
MSEPSSRIWPTVLVSVVGALILTVLPLPQWLQPWRPSWIALVMIYWLIYEPRRIGLMTAWLTGLCLDTLRGVLLGQHALALTIMGFVAMQFHLRVRVFPMGQQTATVFMLVAIYEFMLFWVDGVSGEPGSDWRRWLSVLASTAVWPPVTTVLHRMRLVREPAGEV